MCTGKWGFSLPDDTDILVNATPIGFLDDSKPPIEYTSIGSDMVVCDVIPNKKTTPFLEEVKKALKIQEAEPTGLSEELMAILRQQGYL